SRGPASGDRARHRGHGTRARAVSLGIAPLFHARLPPPHRPAAAARAVKLDVPELGPCLGRLIVPRRVTELWVPLDDVREALASSVMEGAGKARRDASNGAKEGARALAALDRDAWTQAWEDAVRKAADRIVAVLDRTLETEAKRVRMPRRRQRQLAVSPVERRAIAARLASGGDTLGETLNQGCGGARTLAPGWPGGTTTPGGC